MTSVIKVDNIQKTSDGSNIIKKCGSTITIGSSGQTVAVASGATTSGMGRAGTVDWCTTAKTNSFTAVSGDGFFINTADGSPFLNYAVTVASGSLYVVGGTGNAYFLDGSRTMAITLLKGRTYRFTQTDNSNDGHPLIISTSNSSTLGTMQAGIVSSGVSYYLDGASTQSAYINTTSFNAATTRYIEFQPPATGTYYFACYIHGIGMGGAITSQELTVTLPSSPSAGDIVAFADYANTWQTNNVAICRNGSNINGGAFNTTLNTEGQSITLVYVDATRGWKNVQDSTSNVTGTPNFICATGGTVTTCGNFKIHTFNSDGNFIINSAPTPANNNVSYMVVAGGGSGSGGTGGGGGAGGFREGETPAAPYTGSPLKNSSGLPVSVQTYPVSVGAGGRGGGYGPSASNPSASGGNNGSNSIFSTITSAGGGGAGTGSPSSSTDGQPGGSGGGGNGGYGAPQYPGGAGSGNTPPVSPPQGNNGGIGVVNQPGVGGYSGGGGGGATVNGGGGTRPTGVAGEGGAGATSSITGSPVARAGGGGGTGPQGGHGPGGVGGGGAGAGSGVCGNAGTANTGGGGGGIGDACGSSPPRLGGLGGSGVVIIRYKYQ